MAGVGLAVLGVRQPVALIAFMTCAAVVTVILHEWARGTLARHRRGEPYHLAFVRLLSANRPRYGGYVVHIAIIMLSAGAIASSFYSVKRDFVMEPATPSRSASTPSPTRFEPGRVPRPDRRVRRV